MPHASPTGGTGSSDGTGFSDGTDLSGGAGPMDQSGPSGGSGPVAGSGPSDEGGPAAGSGPSSSGGEQAAPGAWSAYRGVPTSASSRPLPPPWRAFDGGPDLPPPPADEREELRRLGAPGTARRAEGEEADLVGAALCLNRPLLVVAPPAADAAPVAYRAARELGLGRVLHWTVTSGSTLQRALWTEPAAGAIRLGPLGTALLPQRLPRVLLVEGLDRGPFDLPLELRRIFQDGSFELPSDAGALGGLGTADPGRTVTLPGSEVRCHAFPLVVISVSETEGLPAEFLAGCLRLVLAPPDTADLLDLAAVHCPEADASLCGDLARQFAERRGAFPDLSVDLFLDAVHLVASGAWPPPGEDPATADLLRQLWQTDPSGGA